MKLAGRVVFNIKVEATWIVSRNDFTSIPIVYFYFICICV